MATLGDIVTTVADQLARSDLNTQIKAEVQNVIRRLRSENLDLSELRSLTLETVAGQTWYDSVSTATVAGLATPAATVSVRDILSIQYMREAPGGSQLLEGMRPISYLDLERLQEGSTSSGDPEYYALYGGQLALWPTPGAVQTIYLSAVVRPVIPSLDADTSVYFDEAQELVEAMTASRVALKYAQDEQMAAMHAAPVAGLLQALRAVSSSRRASGRIRAAM